MYKKGDYITCLDTPQSNPINSNCGSSGGAGFKSNYVFKVHHTSDYKGYQVLWKEIGDNGIVSNSVRYSTDAEIAEYNRLGKPFDITTLKEINPYNFRECDLVTLVSGESFGGWIAKNEIIKLGGRYWDNHREDIQKGNGNCIAAITYDSPNGNAGSCDNNRAKIRHCTPEEKEIYRIKGIGAKTTDIISKESESLVGRYIKALIDNPCNSDAKKDNYYKIIKLNKNDYEIDISEAKFIYKNVEKWKGIIELMPKGFNPNIVESKPRFEVGKWYKNISEKGWYSKFKRLIDNKFEVSDYITNQGKYRTEGWFSLHDGHEEVSLEEIQQYLPEGHVDKLNPVDNQIPERLSFYVKYTEEFTEDLYNKLVEWSKNNCKGKPRNWNDTYSGFRNNYFIFDNWGLNYKTYDKDTIHYGVDNNTQSCKVEKSVNEIKDLINYNKQEYNLLEEAKRRYPIGTKYIGLNSNGNGVYENGISRYNPESETKGFIWVELSNGFIYVNGKWAEIISESKDSKSIIDVIKPYSNIFNVDRINIDDTNILLDTDAFDLLDTNIRKIKPVKTELIQDSELLLF